MSTRCRESQKAMERNRRRPLSYFKRLHLPKENHVLQHRNLTLLLRQGMAQDYKQHIQSSKRGKESCQHIKKICVFLSILVCN